MTSVLVMFLEDFDEACVVEASVARKLPHFGRDFVDLFLNIQIAGEGRGGRKGRGSFDLTLAVGDTALDLPNLESVERVDLYCTECDKVECVTALLLTADRSKGTWEPVLESRDRLLSAHWVPLFVIYKVECSNGMACIAYLFQFLVKSSDELALILLTELFAIGRATLEHGLESVVVKIVEPPFREELDLKIRTKFHEV